MRIDPTSAAHIAAITTRRAAAAQPDQGSAPARRHDAAELSGGAQSARRAHAAAAASPDVRAEKVAEIKARVQAGTYTIDNDALAEKLLDVL
jgi:negative regulator of flagellin synthesis FlgM